ncbi:MAG TPA: AAA family ATPase, partial [Solirubrobacteraceae bacterium]
MPPGGLVQREAELTVLRQALTAARGGAGGVVVVHGTGGSGKSRLLEAAGEMARDADMRVLIAQGRAVERGFPFGVAIQLFEPHWPETQDATTPAGLLDRRALWADRLLSNRTDGIRPLPGDDWFNVIRDLLWLAGHLAAASGGDGPEPGLALLVDDLQRADGPSLRFLAYLATRIADRPMALIVAARTGVPATDPGAAEAIRDAADHVLTPAALSAGGVAAVVRAALPDAGAAFGHACNVVSGGNPFLLSELLQELRRSATSGTMAGAHELAEISPEAVARSVRSLLAELPAEASAVAAAVAVLGDGAPVSRTASVAQLDVASASRGADALAAASVLAPGAPLSFAQPMVATAVRHSLSMLERAELHRRAATALRQDRAPAEHVAAHLLAAEPLGTDPPVHPASAPPAAAQPTGAQPAGVVSRDHLARARLALDRGRALNE